LLAFEGGPALLGLEGCGSNPLRLLTPQVQAGTAMIGFTGHNPSSQYDLFHSNDLFLWSYFGRSALGQSTFNFSGGGALTFFILGTLQDADGDGQTDAYERLVSHTDPYQTLVPLKVFMTRPAALSILP
jgi:hypothetical protein